MQLLLNWEEFDPNCKIRPSILSVQILVGGQCSSSLEFIFIQSIWITIAIQWNQFTFKLSLLKFFTAIMKFNYVYLSYSLMILLIGANHIFPHLNPNLSLLPQPLSIFSFPKFGCKWLEFCHPPWKIIPFEIEGGCQQVGAVWLRW